MSFLSNLFAGGASNIISSVGSVVDNLVTTKGEKMSLDNEIRKAQMQYEVDMKKLSIEEQTLNLSDTKDARAMASAVQTSANASRLSKNIGPYLALGTTLLTFALFFALIFGYVGKGDTKDIVLYILGVLSAIVTQVFSFYFGSSQGSRDKQVTMDKGKN
jgi:hypothetical protein